MRYANVDVRYIDRVTRKYRILRGEPDTKICEFSYCYACTPAGVHDSYRQHPIGRWTDAMAARDFERCGHRHEARRVGCVIPLKNLLHS